MLKVKKTTVINCSDWDKFVESVYSIPYCLQQQNGCMDRQSIHLTVPDKFEAEVNVSPGENHFPVSLEVWKSRDPTQKIKDQEYDWQLQLWYHRNFFPDLQEVANDLYNRGLLEKGEYLIEIDW